MANTAKIVAALEQEKRGLCSGSLVEVNHGWANGSGPVRKSLACFVGALLYQAGYSPKRLRALEGDLSVPLGDDDEPKKNSPEFRARKKLMDVYGLTDEQIDAGINENDNFYASLAAYNSDERFSCEIERRDHMIEWAKGLQ